MLPIVLAAVAAVVWGTADYCGGRATRHAGALPVTVASQLLSLPLLVVCLVLVPGTPRPADLAWGAVAGGAGLIGIVLLYQALSSGAMAVVAPVTAVTAALIPMGVGLVTEGTIGALGLAGTGCAVLAIGLVSMGGDRGGVITPRLVGLALTAGAMFGVFFALLGQASAEAGMWPLATVRASSIALGLLLLARAGGALRAARATWAWIATAGMFDIAANGLYLAAAARGHLSLVAAIASLYPASTVLLALAVDGERVRPVQLAGLGLAATALVLASA